MSRLKLALVFLVLGGLLGFWFSRTSGLPLGKGPCEAIGGKWASVSDQCITRACFRDQSCGTWASPIVYCSKLKIGDPISEVIFQLGTPDSVVNETYYWHATKEGSGQLVGTFSQQRLSSINCGNNP
jgi:hypothetical protein